MDTRSPRMCGGDRHLRVHAVSGAQAAPEGGSAWRSMIWPSTEKPAVLQDHGAGRGAAFRCTGEWRVYSQKISQIFEEANI